MKAAHHMPDIKVLSNSPANVTLPGLDWSPARLRSLKLINCLYLAGNVKLNWYKGYCIVDEDVQGRVNSNTVNLSRDMKNILIGSAPSLHGLEETQCSCKLQCH